MTSVTHLKVSLEHKRKQKSAARSRQSWRNQECDGLISRERFPEIPPRVQYQLSGLGESLLAPLRNLLAWVNVNPEQVRASQSSYDGK